MVLNTRPGPGLDGFATGNHRGQGQVAGAWCEEGTGQQCTRSKNQAWRSWAGSGDSQNVAAYEDCGGQEEEETQNKTSQSAEVVIGKAALPAQGVLVNGAVNWVNKEEKKGGIPAK